MKKSTLFVIIGIITFLLSVSAYQTLKPSDKALDKEFLLKAGFINIPSVVNQKLTKEKNFWYQKGYKFLTWEEFNLLQEKNGFISSTPENYIGDIPDTIVSIVRERYEELEDFRLTKVLKRNIFSRQDEDLQFVLSKNDLAFTLDAKKSSNYKLDEILTDDFLTSNLSVLTLKNNWILEDFNENDGLFISAHHSKFKEGTVKDTGILLKPFVPDPIIYIKQARGIVVLAQW